MENYFVENKETGKLELYFDKTTYLNLDESQKREIKSNFLFSRHNSAWVSRSKFPNLCRAQKVAESLGLENSGTTGKKLSFAEQMEVKAEKAENRADRYEHKAEQAIKKGEALQKPINDMHGDISFFTQPIIAGHTGSQVFARKRNRMWASFEKGMDEFRKSEYYQQRAETARRSTNTPSLDFCQRRIDEAQASIRKLDKSIAEYEDYLKQIEEGKPEITNKYGWKIDVTPESITANIERWEEIKGDAVSKIAYYDSLIQSQGGVKFSKENIKRGYIVKLNKHWKGAVLVVGTGAKNFKYRDVDGAGFELSANYAEIESIIKESEQTIEHPFTVGESFTVKAWNGNEYAPKDYIITKVTADKVTVKSGSERAKAISPKKSYDGKYYLLNVENGPSGYYSKSI